MKKPAPPLAAHSPATVVYAGAAGLAALAVGLSLGLRTSTWPAHYVPLAMAVLASSIWRGLAAGLVATVICIVGFDVFVLPGRPSLEGQVIELTVLMALSGAVIAGAMAIARRRITNTHAALARLDALLDSSPAGHAFYDRDLRYVRVNPALAAIIGKTPQEFEGHTVGEMIPNIVVTVEPLLRQVRDTGEPVLAKRISAEIPVGSSHRYHWLANYYPVKARSGRTLGVGATIIDITAQTRLGEQERTALAQLQAVLQNMSYGVIAIDLKGNILFFNERAEQILGRTPRGTAEAGKEQEGYLLAMDGSALPPDRYPPARVLAEGRPVTGDRIRYRHPNGSVLFLEWSATPIRYGESNAISGVVNLLKDVTCRVNEETRAELLSEVTVHLHASLDYGEVLPSVARMMVPLLTDWCLIDLFDDAGQTHPIAVVHSNPMTERHGVEMRERYPGEIYRSAAGRATLQQGKPLLVPRVTEDVLRSFAADEEHLRVLQSFQACSAIAVPLSVRGRALGILILLMSESGRHFGASDIDFVRELARRIALAIDNGRLYQQAHEAIKVRDEFLSVASHDLRAPLTSLKLRLQRLGRSMPSDPAALREALDGLDAQVNRVSHMINVLMDVTRLQSGRLTLERAEVDLEAVVLDTLQRLEPVLASAGCEARLRPGGSAIGHWDRFRLEQVVTNLLTNATKYGAGKPIEIFIDATPTSALLRVRDHGIGIAPEHLPKLFQRFERVGNTKAFAGSGLGLWITRQIVEAHGGSIDVQSTPEQGTTFSVLLPLAQVSAGVSAPLH